MKIYLQLLIIFGFSFIGNVISNVFRLPVPGSILGMILLFLALQFKILEFRHVDEAGSFLINNMTILFLPPAVGIMDKFDVIQPYLFPIVMMILGAIIINVSLIALVVGFIKTRYEGDYEGGKR